MAAVETAQSGTDWLPLVVAALGIVGTLAAAVFTQVYQSRQEDRRWEREREERIKSHNLDDRRKSYLEFLEFLAPWRDWTQALAAGEANANSILYRPDAQETPAEGRRLMHALLLLSPNNIWVHASAVFHRIERVANEGYSMNSQELRAVVEEQEAMYQGLLVHMREDLGVRDFDPALFGDRSDDGKPKRFR